MDQKIKISELPIFDIVDYLKTDQDREQYLAAVLKTGDPDLLTVAIADVTKARNACN